MAEIHMDAHAVGDTVGLHRTQDAEVGRPDIVKAGLADAQHTWNNSGVVSILFELHVDAHVC
jgi:hypothetical protein